MFAEPNLSKFDVRKLSDVKPPSSSKLDKEYQQSQQAHSDKKYNEQDYDCKLSMSIVDGFDCHLSPLALIIRSTSQEIISATACAAQSLANNESTNV